MLFCLLTNIEFLKQDPLRICVRSLISQLVGLHMQAGQQLLTEIIALSCILYIPPTLAGWAHRQKTGLARLVGGDEGLICPEIWRQMNRTGMSSFSRCFLYFWESVCSCRHSDWSPYNSSDNWRR